MCLGPNDKGGPKRCAGHARTERDKQRAAAEEARAAVADLENQLADAERHYPDDAAFREALKVRIRRIAAATGEPHDKVARRFAIQQLVMRLAADDPESWVLTGGTALQYRTGEARTTQDADLATRIQGDQIEERMTAALARKPGERGDFTVKVKRRSSEIGGYTCSVVYTLGGTRFSTAFVDIVPDRGLPESPELITPAAVVDIDDASPSVPVRFYPAAHHTADKTAAMFQTYGSTGTEPSTRPHDLADLVILARTVEVDAEELHERLAVEAARRGVTYPKQLTIPNPAWRDAWEGKVIGPGLPDQVRDIDSALQAAGAFLNPILSGAVRSGRWDRTSQTWRPHPGGPP